MRIVGNTNISRNWQEFLRVNDNKTELSHFVAEGLVGGLGYNEKKTFVTYDERVRCVGKQLDVHNIDLCNYEEADMHLILHCNIDLSFFSMLQRTDPERLPTELLLLMLLFWQLTTTG